MRKRGRLAGAVKKYRRRGMAGGLAERLMNLGFKDEDFEVRDDMDGLGPRLIRWLSASPQPTAAQIAAAEAPLPSLLSAQDDAAIAAIVDTPGSAVRALAKLVFKLMNEVRVLKGQQPLTAAQFKAALKAEIRA